jgi:hypothetical protein
MRHTLPSWKNYILKTYAEYAHILKLMKPYLDVDTHIL